MRKPGTVRKIQFGPNNLSKTVTDTGSRTTQHSVEDRYWRPNDPTFGPKPLLMPEWLNIRSRTITDTRATQYSVQKRYQQGAPNGKKYYR